MTQRGSKQPPLPLRLEDLQRRGRLVGLPFSAVPPSCQTGVESLLDMAGELKSTVLLGFTRDGSHLISYTTQPVAAAEGAEGYALQLWSYQQGQPCRRLWSVPLFRTQPYLESLEDEEDFMADDMLLTVAEAPDSSLLVVHGRTADAGTSREQHLPNFVTCIPGPLHAGAALLQVVHLSYNSSYPHAPFNPIHFITPLGDGANLLGSSSMVGSSSSSWGDGVPLAVALYTGDGLRFLHVAASRQAAPPAQPSASQQAAPSGEDEEDSSSSSRFSSPERLLAAGQRTPVQPPIGPGILQQQQQQQQARSGSVSPAPSPSPRSSPWHRQGRHRWQRPRSAASPSAAAAGSNLDCELGAQAAVLPCAHAAGDGGGMFHSGLGSAGAGSGLHGGSRALAAVSIATAPQQLDLEACLFDALRQQGLAPTALVDYAAAPVQGGAWQEQEGLLLLAVLRLMWGTTADAPADVWGGAAVTAAAQQQLRPQQQGWAPPPAPRQAQQQQQQQPQHRSACVLLHAAARDGSTQLVEWLEPPYPWHHDLSAFLVQQTAFAGLAFEKAPAFFAEFLARRYGSGPLPRCRLPLVLTNRSVLGSGTSLPHIVHPWLPQAILGYGQGDGSSL